jgi:hypothetical protein
MSGKDAGLLPPSVQRKIPAPRKNPSPKPSASLIRSYFPLVFRPLKPGLPSPFIRDEIPLENRIFPHPSVVED